jgi:hypothetical protein
MLDFLQKLKNDPEGPFDAYFFLPGEKKDQLHVESAIYKTPGENVGGGSMGHAYHIILFKENDQGVYNLDQFEAVFVEPLEYMSDLIKQDWYGIVCRKTTTSTSFVQNLFDKIKN